MTIVFCRQCGGRYELAGAVPPVCPTCRRRTRWTTTPVTPQKPYVLSEQDRKLLRSFWIAPEV